MDKIKHINLPLEPDAHSDFMWVRDDNGMLYPIVQLRGWGHLTGKGGGLGLDGAESLEIQNKFAEFLALAVNNHQALIDTINDLLAKPKSPIADCPADLVDDVTDCECGRHAAEARAINALLHAGEQPPFGIKRPEALAPFQTEEVPTNA